MKKILFIVLSILMLNSCKLHRTEYDVTITYMLSNNKDSIQNTITKRVMLPHGVPIVYVVNDSFENTLEIESSCGEFTYNCGVVERSKLKITLKDYSFKKVSSWEEGGFLGKEIKGSRIYY